MSRNATADFALIGVADFVAPHLAAIPDTESQLIAAFDTKDSVGILNTYFPDAEFFTEFERFDKLRRGSSPVDYVSICSPNYLHDSHVRFVLRSGADAVCEKPLVLNPWNINSSLRLRVHPSIMALREEVPGEETNSKHEVDLNYVTFRDLRNSETKRSARVSDMQT